MDQLKTQISKNQIKSGTGDTASAGMASVAVGADIRLNPATMQLPLPSDQAVPKGPPGGRWHIKSILCGASVSARVAALLFRRMVRLAPCYHEIRPLLTKTTKGGSGEFTFPIAV